MNITITRRRFTLLLLAIVAGTAVIAITGAYFGFKAAGQAVTIAPTAATAAPVSPAPELRVNEMVPTTDNGEGVELVPGTGTGKYNEPKDEFRCKAGFVPVQVPIGETKQVNGATYTVKETRTSYGDQESVRVTIKLSAGVSAPTMFLNTGAHKLAPEVYPQHKIQIALAAGGSGDYTLQTDGYLDNYKQAGIIDATVCTKASK